MRRSLVLRRRACCEPTDWRSSASSRSSRPIDIRPARPAMIAASFKALASWAPVRPVVLRATSVRSILSDRVLPRACERRIAARPSRSGGATSTWRSEQCLVQLVDLVRRRQHDHHAWVSLEAVELHEQLVERLLTLGRAAVPGSRAAMAPDGIELVDEDNRAAG